jgi:hypothetical protein
MKADIGIAHVVADDEQDVGLFSILGVREGGKCRGESGD